MKICPVTNDKVLYLACMECEEKKCKESAPCKNEAGTTREDPWEGKKQAIHTTAQNGYGSAVEMT